MIRTIANLVDGSVQLLEAEGRLASVHVVRLLTLTVIYAALALIGIAAILCIGAGVVLILAESIGLGPAMIATGIGTGLCCAAAVLWAHNGLTTEG